MADVNELFCDKHTFLPCIESEVRLALKKNMGWIVLYADTSSIQTGAYTYSCWTCE